MIFKQQGKKALILFQLTVSEAGARIVFLVSKLYGRGGTSDAPAYGTGQADCSRNSNCLCLDGNPARLKSLGCNASAASAKHCHLRENASPAGLASRLLRALKSSSDL